MAPAAKLGIIKNQIIPMKQFGIITLGSHLLFSLPDQMLQTSHIFKGALLLSK